MGVDQKEKENRYWKAQFAAISALKEIGLEFRVRDRISPFKILTKNVRKFWRNPESHESAARFAYIEAEKCLGLLVYLRCLGCEPAHKNGIYT